MDSETLNADQFLDTVQRFLHKMMTITLSPISPQPQEADPCAFASFRIRLRILTHHSQTTHCHCNQADEDSCRRFQHDSPFETRRMPCGSDGLNSRCTRMRRISIYRDPGISGPCPLADWSRPFFRPWNLDGGKLRTPDSAVG